MRLRHNPDTELQPGMTEGTAGLYPKYFPTDATLEAKGGAQVPDSSGVEST